MKDDFNEFKLSKEVKKKLKDKVWLKKELESGRSAQEIVGFSDETMGKFYRAAFHLFENKKYEPAANAFLFLATLNPYNYEYWLGLGMAEQMCQEFEVAVDAYEMAAIVDPTNPVPYFYLSKCFFAIHERKNALSALDLAVEFAGDNEEFFELKQQALAAKSLLLKRRK